MKTAGVYELLGQPSYKNESPTSSGDEAMVKIKVFKK